MFNNLIKLTIMSKVTIAGVVVRTSKKDGREFLSITVVGDLDIVTSAKTGNQSLVAMKCNISSNLPVGMASSLIGQQIEGQVVKVPCTPYQWTNPTTAEVVELSHTYRYQKTAFHAPVGENAPAKANSGMGDAAATAKVLADKQANFSRLKAIGKAKRSAAEQAEFLVLAEEFA